MELRALLEAKRNCTECGLRATASQVVLPHLPPNPIGAVLFLGRNPGATEDRDGAPFIGRAGKELDNWIEYLGWWRDDVVIENAVACLTLDNREPTMAEIRTCERCWLEPELKILKPRLIVILGRDAALSLGVDAGHGETVKTPHGVGYALWHPSYLLRAPGQRKKLYADLDRLKRVLKNQEQLVELRRQYDES